MTKPGIKMPSERKEHNHKLSETAGSRAFFGRKFAARWTLSFMLSLVVVLCLQRSADAFSLADRTSKKLEASSSPLFSGPSMLQTSQQKTKSSALWRPVSARVASGETWTRKTTSAMQQSFSVALQGTRTNNDTPSRSSVRRSWYLIRLWMRFFLRKMMLLCAAFLTGIVVRPMSSHSVGLGIVTSASVSSETISVARPVSLRTTTNSGAKPQPSMSIRSGSSSRSILSSASTYRPTPLVKVRMHDYESPTVIGANPMAPAEQTTSTDLAWKTKQGFSMLRTPQQKVTFLLLLAILLAAVARGILVLPGRGNQQDDNAPPTARRVDPVLLAKAMTSRQMAEVANNVTSLDILNQPGVQAEAANATILKLEAQLSSANKTASQFASESPESGKKSTVLPTFQTMEPNPILEFVNTQLEQAKEVIDAWQGNATRQVEEWVSVLQEDEKIQEEKDAKIIAETPALAGDDPDIVKEWLDMSSGSGTTTGPNLAATTNRETLEESVEEVLEEPAEDILAEPAGDILEEPEGDILEEPAEDILEEPAEDIPEEPAEDILEEPAEDISEEPVDNEPASEKGMKAHLSNYFASWIPTRAKGASAASREDATEQIVSSDSSDAPVNEETSSTGEETEPEEEEEVGKAAAEEEITGTVVKEEEEEEEEAIEPPIEEEEPVDVEETKPPSRAPVLEWLLGPKISLEEKYGNITNIEERAFQILRDLKMI